MMRPPVRSPRILFVIWSSVRDVESILSVANSLCIAAANSMTALYSPGISWISHACRTRCALSQKMYVPTDQMSSVTRNINSSKKENPHR